MLNHNNMPGAGSITETLEFMRKMWGSMGAPAMGIPSLSVEEINKKISDLKTVASWLELNLNMLRATIQTMEVQSATLTTLQAMGAMLTPRDAQESAADDRGAAEAPSSFANWPERTATSAAASGAAADEEADETEDDEDLDEPEEVAQDPLTAPGATAEPEAAGSQQSRAGEPPAQPAAGAGMPDYQAMTNPNAWWNLLQEQFKQAVGNVLAEQEPAPAAAKPASTGKAAATKKTTKPKAAAKAGPRAKTTVVQSRPSKSVSRKPQSP